MVCVHGFDKKGVWFYCFRERVSASLPRWLILFESKGRGIHLKPELSSCLGEEGAMYSNARAKVNKARVHAFQFSLLGCWTVAARQTLKSEGKTLPTMLVFYFLVFVHLLTSGLFCDIIMVDESWVAKTRHFFNLFLNCIFSICSLVVLTKIE